jgi:hypothetical protein
MKPTAWLTSLVYTTWLLTIACSLPHKNDPITAGKGLWGQVAAQKLFKSIERSNNAHGTSITPVSNPAENANVLLNSREVETSEVDKILHDEYTGWRPIRLPQTTLDGGKLVRLVPVPLFTQNVFRRMTSDEFGCTTSGPVRNTQLQHNMGVPSALVLQISYIPGKDY